MIYDERPSQKPMQRGCPYQAPQGTFIGNPMKQHFYVRPITIKHKSILVLQYFPSHWDNKGIKDFALNSGNAPYSTTPAAGEMTVQRIHNLQDKPEISLIQIQRKIRRIVRASSGSC